MDIQSQVEEVFEALERKGPLLEALIQLMEERGLVRRFREESPEVPLETSYNIPGKHILDRAKVFGDAKVYGIAQVFGNAQVYGIAEVFNNAQVFGNAEVGGTATILGGKWDGSEGPIIEGMWKAPGMPA